MSKYRKGIVYLRKMKKTDRAKDFRTAVRLDMFSDPKIWKHPESLKPVVMAQHGVKGVSNVWMNQDEAIRSLLTSVTKRRRNAKHNPRRGLRLTKGDLKKAFRRWRFPEARNVPVSSS